MARKFASGEFKDAKPAARAVYRENPGIDGASEEAIVERLALKFNRDKPRLIEEARRELECEAEEEDEGLLCGTTFADRHRIARHLLSLPPKERAPLAAKLVRVLAEVDHLRGEVRRFHRREGWRSTQEADLWLEFLLIAYEREALGAEFWETVMRGFDPEDRSSATPDKETPPQSKETTKSTS
jgi:hypothetical protein